MSATPSSEDIDDLIGRWQSFADMEINAIAAGFKPYGIELVNTVLRRALDQTATSFKNGQEFSAFVKQLRDNERSWSYRLGEVILRSQALVDANEPDAARRQLEAFESECPWTIYREVAQIQRHNICEE